MTEQTKVESLEVEKLRDRAVAWFANRRPGLRRGTEALLAEFVAVREQALEEAAMLHESIGNECDFDRSRLRLRFDGYRDRVPRRDPGMQVTAHESLEQIAERAAEQINTLAAKRYSIATTAMVILAALRKVKRKAFEDR